MTTLPRTLEPEVMDSAAEAREYDAMDLADVNSAFITDLLSVLDEIADNSGGRAPANRITLLDAGTGTARIPLELARRADQVEITAIDVSARMLEVGEAHIERAGLFNRVRLLIADCKSLPFLDDSFDAVVSNSLIHHLPRPREALAEFVRVLRPTGHLFLRDLVRPESISGVDELVARHARGESPRARALFRDSLHAALTLAEIRDLLEDLNLPRQAARLSSDRHWTVCIPAVDHRSSADRSA